MDAVLEYYEEKNLESDQINHLISRSLKEKIRVDAESDLKNIIRPLSNDPQKKYIPDENMEVSPDMNIFNNVKNNFFHSESMRLNEPAFELKGMTKNRFNHEENR